MSLVIASNIQGEYEVSNGRENENFGVYNSAKGLSRPYSFQNHINPPLKIPANSEVALQSIKLNRAGNYSLATNRVFAFYIGEEIQQADGISKGGDTTDPNAAAGSEYEDRSLSGNNGSDYRGTTSMPFHVTIRKGTYTPAQMAKEITHGLHVAIGHPDMYLTCNVAEQDDANENGTGFNFGFTWQGDQSETNLIDTGEMPAGTTINGRVASIDVSSADGGGSGTDMTLDLTNSRITKKSAGEYRTGSCAIDTYPISLEGGCLEVNVEDCQSGFRVGFVRPFQTDGREAPEYFSGEAQDFYDYVVEWSQEANETEYSLKLKHAVWESQSGSTMIMKSINYWESGLSGVPTDHINQTYLTAHAGATIKKIKLQVEGEHVITSWTSSTDSIHVLTDTTQAFENGEEILKTKCFKPVGQTCWGMTPAFGIEEVDEHMSVLEYGGLMNGLYPPSESEDPIALPNWRTPLTQPNTSYYANPKKADPTTGQVQTSGQSYWMRSYVDENARIGCKNIDSRSCYIDDDGLAQKEYVGCQVNDDGDIQGIEMCWVIITKPSNNGYNTELVGSYTAPFIDDCGGLLGLQGSDAFSSAWVGFMYDRKDPATPLNFMESEAGIFSWWICSSFDRPTITAGSLFVRCPTLTHQSFNMGKGIPSKIIYQIPRFSTADNNAGRVGAGELYFEPAQMTYLDLNNPSPLTFNDLTLEIVDKNEIYAKDLTGATTIVLHFRQKQMKG